MTATTPPDVFTHPRLEYEALTHTVGLIDLSNVGVLRLRGGDRARFLNAMVTNDVATLHAGNACEALLTTTKGRIVAELLILSRADELLVLVMQGSTARVFEALDSHIIADDVQLTDMSAEMTVLSLEGPKSRDVVWRLFPREPIPLEVLKFSENEYQGLHAIVVRRSVTGEKGLHVIVSRGQSERLRDFFVQAGVGMDMQVVGRVAWNMRRVEAGLPWYGHDVSEDNFPKEARLDDHVNYEKGCYMGQEPIARMHYRGHPNWLLVGLAASRRHAGIARVSGALRKDQRVARCSRTMPTRFARMHLCSRSSTPPVWSSSHPTPTTSCRSRTKSAKAVRSTWTAPPARRPAASRRGCYRRG